MIKRLLAIVALLLCVASVDARERWKLVWSDEFDVDGLPDDSRWSFDTEGNAWEWGNREDQFYTARDTNAVVKDGVLIITALREEWTEKVEGKSKTKHYTSARLRTLGKGDWRYGRFEIRAKLPTGRGTWPAIWMMPEDDRYGSWPACGEIDIMENIGCDPNVIMSTAHTAANNHKAGTAKGGRVTLPTAYQQFHTYALEWDENHWSGYVDDTHVFTYSREEGDTRAEWPYDQRFHLILNLAIGGGWAGRDGIDDALFPHQFIIDYVRVYERRQ